MKKGNLVLAALCILNKSSIKCIMLDLEVDFARHTALMFRHKTKLTQFFTSGFLFTTTKASFFLPFILSLIEKTITVFGAL